MTSRHAHDDTRWKVGPVAGTPAPPDHAVHSTPIPESADLPRSLDLALTALTEPAGPAVSFVVRPDPESVTEARHFAISRLTEWGVPELVDNVGLVVSELVTNALRHSGGVAPRCLLEDVHREDIYRAPVGYREPSGFYEPTGYSQPSGYGKPTGYGQASGSCEPTGYGEPTGYSESADPLRSAPSAIRLRLVYEPPGLLCGIMDASRAAPCRKEPDYIAETGRGLHLVESFSVRWGWRTLPGGKVVWALFRTP